MKRIDTLPQQLLLAAYILLTTAPLLLGFGYSLLYSFELRGLLSKGFTTEHWTELFTSSAFWSSFFYTVYLSVFSVFISLFFALFFSYKILFSKNEKDIYGLLYLPLLFPPAIIAFLFFELLSKAGFISRLCYQIGLTQSIDSFPRLTNDFWSVGIFAAHTYLIFPIFTIYFIHLAKKERLLDLKKICQTLGGNDKQFIIKVFIPIILQKSAPIILLYGIFLMGSYEIPMLLGRQSPQVLTIFITEKLSKFDLNNIPLAHAAACAYTLLILSFVFFLEKLKKKAL